MKYLPFFILVLSGTLFAAQSGLERQLIHLKNNLYALNHELGQLEPLTTRSDTIRQNLVQLKTKLTALQQSLTFYAPTQKIIRKAKGSEERTAKVETAEPIGIVAEEPRELIIEEPIKIPSEYYNVTRLSDVPYEKIYKIFNKNKGRILANLSKKKPIIQLLESLNLSSLPLGIYFHFGYIYIANDQSLPTAIMKGKQVLGNLELVMDAFAKKDQISKKQLTAHYKIHLMPKNGDDMMLIIENLLNELKFNDLLQRAINSFKFKPIDFSGSREGIKKRLTRGDEIFPLMVIYAADGKENAQIVLDTVYRLFGDINGLDITPRYNKKVTSLIYYAQGDGDIKETYARYFTPDKIFFKPDFEGEGLNIDYSLKNPAEELSEEVIIEEPIKVRKAKEVEGYTAKVKEAEQPPISLEEPREEPELEEHLIRLSKVSYDDIYEMFEREKKHSVAILNNEKPMIQLKNELGFNENGDSLGSFYQEGYIFLVNINKQLMKGKTTLANPDDVKSAFRKIKDPKSKKQLADQYKIHLMPKSGDDLMLIIENLLHELKTNNKLQDAIQKIKFMPIDFSGFQEDIKKILTKGGEVRPIIVIYPADGKDNAQFVLDRVYNMFGDMEGLDITPRYNQKITPLIYYAQSHGDFKDMYAEYFTPDKIFFRPDFEGEDLNIDYSLKNPADSGA
jgi:hypothetical protein